MRFFDLETRGTVDLKVHGLDNHIAGLIALTLVTWQDINLETGEAQPVQVWEPFDDDAPEDLLTPPEHAGPWVAYNSRYDRLAWNALRREYGLPHLEIEHVYDLAAFAGACAMPDKLARVAKELGLADKLPGGDMLFIADATNPLPPRDSDAWQRFVEYGRRDTELLWPIWQALSQLNRMRPEDWAQFHASEHINDRGVPVDTELARRCAAHAEAERENNRKRLGALLGEPDISLFQSGKLAQWVFERLPEEQRPLMIRGDKKADPPRLSLDSKKILPRLLDHVDDPVVTPVFDLLSYARGSAVTKFQRIVDTAHVDTAVPRHRQHPRVYGAFVFNGASPGRYSSRGLQVHNMVRKTATPEFINAVLADAPLEELRGLTNIELAPALAQAVRPCVVAPEGRTFVWADYSAIEARMLPWLAQDGTEELLDRYRRGEDVYVHQASDIFGVSPDEIDDNQRQAGKVAILSCGYGGGAGAYQGMARNYGLKPTRAEAAKIVDGWRASNPWASKFWNKLTKAMERAVAMPNTSQQVGRLTLLYAGQTLLIALPSGRFISYPRIKRRKAEVEDPETGLTKKRWRWQYRRGGGFTTLWHGILAENATQGEAASLLREALVDLQEIAVLHVHDEVVAEADEDRAEETASLLRAVLLKDRGWNKGLPLDVEVASDWWYHK